MRPNNVRGNANILLSMLRFTGALLWTIMAINSFVEILRWNQNESTHQKLEYIIMFTSYENRWKFCCRCMNEGKSTLRSYSEFGSPQWEPWRTTWNVCINGVRLLQQNTSMVYVIKLIIIPINNRNKWFQTERNVSFQKPLLCPSISWRIRQNFEGLNQKIRSST